MACSRCAAFLTAGEANRTITGSDALIEMSKVLARPAGELAHRERQALVVDRFGEPPTQCRRRSRIDDSKLGEEPAQPVHERRALFLPSLAHAMAREAGLLLGGLDRHEAHRRVADRQSDRFSVVAIILHGPALPVRLDELRRHDARLETELRHSPGPVVSRAARLHADDAAARQLRQPLHHTLTLELAALRDAAVCAHHACREHRLCQVNANRRNIHGETSPSFKIDPQKLNLGT